MATTPKITADGQPQANKPKTNEQMPSEGTIITKEVSLAILLTTASDKRKDWTLRITINGEGQLLLGLYWKDKVYPTHTATVNTKAFVGALKDLTDGQ